MIGAAKTKKSAFFFDESRQNSLKSKYFQRYFLISLKMCIFAFASAYRGNDVL